MSLRIGQAGGKGSSGGGIILYKSVSDLTRVTSADKTFLQGEFDRGGISLVQKTPENTYWRWIQDGTWKWQEFTGIIRGPIGPSGTNGLNGVSIQTIRYKQDDLDGNKIYEILLDNGTIAGEITVPKGTPSDNEGYIKFFGDNTKLRDGRLRYDQTKGHWYFEVRQQDGSYIQRFEIGESATVDTIYLEEGIKPHPAPGYLAIYNKWVDTADQGRILMPTFVTPQGNEYGFVVVNLTNGKIVYRTADGIEHVFSGVNTDNLISQLELDAENLIGKNEQGQQISSVDLSSISGPSTPDHILVDGGKADSSFVSEVDGGGA